MIPRLLVATLLLAVPAAAGWLAVESISGPGDTAQTCENNARAVVCDGTGSIHVVWRGKVGGVWQVFYSRSDSGHGRWTEAEVLRHGAGDAGEPVLSLDSLGRVLVTWFGGGALRVHRWDRGAGLWDSLPSLVLGPSDSSVSTATDGSNRLHVTWRHGVSGERSIRYCSYAGTGWDTVSVVSAHDGLAGRPSVASDGVGNTMVAWRGGTTPRSILTRTRTGSGWQRTDTVSTADACDWPSVACSPGPNFHVCWKEDSAGRERVVLRDSGAAGWSATTRVDVDAGDKRGPCVGVAGERQLWVAWASRGGSGDTVLAARRSDSLWLLDTLAFGSRISDRVSLASTEGLAQVTWTEWASSREPQVLLRRFEEVHDVGVLATGGLPEQADSGDVLRPEATIANHGEFLEQAVTVVLRAGGYHSEVRLDSLAPGVTAVATFDSLVLSRRDWFVVVCSTSVAGDRFRANDTLRDSVLVRVYDVSVSGVVSPDTLVGSDSVVPSALVRNTGNTWLFCSPRMTMWRGESLVYSNTVYLSLVVGADSLVSFPAWRTDSGRFVARCSVAYDRDMRPENDTASRTFRVVRRDVGVVRILDPVGRLDSGAVVVPKARVMNYGSEAADFAVGMSIGPSYSDAESVEALRPGESSLVSFDPCTLLARGDQPVVCFTTMAGDRFRGNDTARGPVFVRVTDAAAEEILFPAEVIGRGTVQPLARATNRGNEAARIPFRFGILRDSASVYEDSAAIELAPGETSEVQFANWTATGGTYLAVCSTGLVADRHPGNDTASRVFRVARIDAELVAVVRPCSVMAEGRVEPEVIIWNRGEVSGDIRTFVTVVTVESTHVYAESVLTEALAPDQRRSVYFPSWSAGPGLYRVLARVGLGNDEHAANDTASTVVRVDSVLVRRWSERAVLPRGSRNLRVGSGGGLAATGSGLLALKGSGTSEFYRYDAAGDSWSARASLPVPAAGGKVGRGAALAAGGGTCFATRGNKRRDFFGYSESADTWVSLCELPVGAGSRSGSCLAVVPSAETTKAYLVLGGNSVEFLAYWAGLDEWHARRPLPTGPRNRKAGRGTALAACGNRLFCMKGGTNEFYEYLPACDRWQSRSNVPLVSRAGRRRRCRDGAALASDGSRLVYALKGGRSNTFWAYDVAADTWAELEEVPTGNDLTRVRAGSGLAVVGGRPYCLKGGSRELWFYDPAALRLPVHPPRPTVVTAAAVPAAPARPFSSVARAPGLDTGPRTELRDACGRRVRRGSSVLPAGVYFEVSGERVVRRVVAVR